MLSTLQQITIFSTKMRLIQFINTFLLLVVLTMTTNPAVEAFVARSPTTKTSLYNKNTLRRGAVNGDNRSSPTLINGADISKNGATKFPSSPTSIITPPLSSAPSSLLDTRENNNDEDNSQNSQFYLDPYCTLPKDKARARRPAFPAASYYPLFKDEEDLQHRFISFVDQSIFQTYSQAVRLVEPRSYARPNQFRKENASKPPTIHDVAEPKSLYGPLATIFAWNGLPARFIVGTVSYVTFPFIIELLQRATATVDPVGLGELVDTFLPGISIVLGTYFSLTISILYDRFAKLQEAVSLEASLLAMTAHNLVNLFADNDPEAAVEGAQCIADQVRTMVFDSRGRETMGIIYSDPYVRILRLLKDYDQSNCRNAHLLSDLHNSVTELFRLRSHRLNYEALALAPTHFDVMTFLCGLLLTGFALGTVASGQTDGIPSQSARILFASLVVCYTIFYEMAFDLNRPFDGIYQIRRSGAATHFLQIKQLVCNHPVLAGRVDFEEVAEDDTFFPDCDGDCQQLKSRIWYN